MIISLCCLVFSLSNLVPGKNLGMPTNSLNFKLLKLFSKTNCTSDITIQYRLKPLGNVIHIGTVINGKKYIYLLILLIVGLRFAVDVDIILSKFNIPPTKGKIQNGSGDERSLNHKKPSVNIAGFMS